jgi:hypothetical protein
MTEDGGDVPLDKDPNPEKEAKEFEGPEEEAKHLRSADYEQDISERRKFATRSFILTCVWLGFVVVSTIAQFTLNAVGHGLDTYQFITLITTTTASVFGFWLLVGRYLFPSSPPPEAPQARGASKVAPDA